LRVSLLLGEHMLGAGYPDELRRCLPPTPRARRLAARVAAELFTDGFGGRSFVRGQFALRPRYRDRLRFAAAVLLHAGGDATDAGAGAALARPLRVLRKYWRQGSS
jgi:hypothetical protein